MIDIKIREKKFGDLLVLENVYLQINEGEFITILGPSGCGKSTLLRVIGGFEDFDGTVKIKEIVKDKPGKDAIMVFKTLINFFLG